MIDPARKKVLDGIGHTMCRALSARPLLDADVILDEVRRFALMRIFSGHPDDGVQGVMQCGPLVLELARHYAPLSAAEVMYIDAMMRHNLWAAHFATLPDTRFGAQWEAFLERAKSGASPNQLN